MAKKEVSAIMSGMGVELLTRFVEKARKRGLSDEAIHQLAMPEGDALLDRFVNLMAEADWKIGNVFNVTVNYDSRLELMIKDGTYDWKNSDINSKNFPIEGKGKVEVTLELVHFNRVVESDEVLRDLDKETLRPATLPELLAFGATYPGKQRKFPIVALGSVWRDWLGRRHVPFLWSDSSVRDLGLDWLESRWLGLCRFAAVRK